MHTAPLYADPTPRRPSRPLPRPDEVRAFDVVVDVAHLANPVVAVQRMLATDMGAFARVVGDEHRFTIELIVPRTASDDLDAWVRWIVHHAGVRGTIHPR